MTLHTDIPTPAEIDALWETADPASVSRSSGCRTMPSDVASAVGKSSIKERVPIRKLQGDEGQKVRSVCRYPDLVPETAAGNPESTSDADVVGAARDVLDRYYAAGLAELKALFEQRTGQNRTSLDVATVGRLATDGAVDTLFLDIDAVVPGTVATDGAVTFARLVAVRRADVPGDGDLAAILRYAV